MLTIVSGVKYPIMPIFLPPTSSFIDGCKLVTFFRRGSILRFRFAQTTGDSTFSRNWIKLSTPSSNSWLPRHWKKKPFELHFRVEFSVINTSREVGWGQRSGVGRFSYFSNCFIPIEKSLLNSILALFGQFCRIIFFANENLVLCIVLFLYCVERAVEWQTEGIVILSK